MSIPAGFAAGNSPTPAARAELEGFVKSIPAVTALATYIMLFAPMGADAAEAAGAGSPSLTTAEIRRLLESDQTTIGGADILARDVLRQAYSEVDFEPFWTDSANVGELLQLIDQATEHGLIPEDYHQQAVRDALPEHLHSTSGPEWAATDILLTESLLRYGYHRRFGKIKANSLDPYINYRRETFNDQQPGTTLRQALSAPSLEGFIDSVAPVGPVYASLQTWLKRFRAIAANGGWPAVPEGPTLRSGDRDPRILPLRERLTTTGELHAEAVAEPDVFDPALEQAVKVFQRHHALEADGIVGRNTITALNVPVTQRIDQLRLSLERLRWVNQEAADTLVAVNIAGFRAFFFRDGALVWETRAMVGKTYRQTPTFRGEMSYLEFNPTWTIPPGILRNDTLPAIKRDPGYLASKNIRVLDRQGNEVDPSTIDWSQYSKGIPFTLRQDPGPQNALGTVKFIFPNPYFVFLHDTPNPELFERPERAFSSGCIRIEDPLRLAELILDDAEKYPRSTLESIVRSGKIQRINLADQVPVLIVYLTASIDDDGSLLLYRDIYDRDAKALKALDGPVIVDPPPSG
jgi:murein L,D-transpeptidase YcbB/YkuD